MFNPPFINSSNNYVSKTIDNNNSLTGGGSYSKTKLSETNSSGSTGVSGSLNHHHQANNLSASGKPQVTNAHSRESQKGRNRSSNQGVNKNRNEPREVTPSPGDNDSSHGDLSGGDFSGRRQQFSDDQQVFVGNLLQDISEDQLRNFFKKFGNIIDVRINRTNQKSGRTPNYGFVTFDDPSIVKKILSQKVSCSFLFSFLITLLCFSLVIIYFYEIHSDQFKCPR